MIACYSGIVSCAIRNASYLYENVDYKGAACGVP
jgi:hypothetical protein